jgi:hypothetical protein
MASILREVFEHQAMHGTPALIDADEPSDRLQVEFKPYKSHRRATYGFELRAVAVGRRDAEGLAGKAADGETAVGRRHRADHSDTAAGTPHPVRTRPSWVGDENQPLGRSVWVCFAAVARQLVLIPRPRERLVGARGIEPGYPRDYTPEQMRQWAGDLDRLNRTAPEELERWQRTAPEQLTPEQQRSLVAYTKYYGDSDARLTGSLLPDGTVDLTNGHHRVAYLQEQGVEPVPVWVAATDQRELDRFTAECERELARQSPREAPPPRVADDRARENDQDRNETRSERAR